ncbi:MAG: hypothetical protein IPJ07_26800 [Acidobacteria bacterium]|nr:hypothetical protein [Acidobacteriota bacterium]
MFSRTTTAPLMTNPTISTSEKNRDAVEREIEGPHHPEGRDFVMPEWRRRR